MSLVIKSVYSGYHMTKESHKIKEKLKKPVTKKPLNAQKRQILRKRFPPTVSAWGKWGVTANGHRVSFWGDENVLKLDYGNSCINCKHNKSHNCTC